MDPFCADVMTLSFFHVPASFIECSCPEMISLMEATAETPLSCMRSTLGERIFPEMKLNDIAMENFRNT